MPRRRETPPFLEPGKRRTLIAFVEGQTPAQIGSPYSRIGLLLDCADAHAFMAEPEGEDDPRNLAIVRVLSTPSRLQQLFGLPRTPREGDWLAIQLGDAHDRPMAWAVSAFDDYRGPPELSRVLDMRFVPDSANLERERGRAGRPRGEIDPAREVEDAALFLSTDALALLQTPNPSASTASGDAELLVMLHLALSPDGAPPHPRVLDVGQASCNAMYKQRDPAADVLWYFDVGAPLWFHASTMPQPCDFKLPLSGGFVVLSHWDFDHYAMAWRAPELKKLRWFAPRQQVGRNGRSFQRQLGGNLRFIEGDVQLGDLIKLQRLNGKKGDRNSTGYALWLKGADGPRLLTGDAGYNHIPKDLKSGLKGVTMPHHGGRGAGKAPRPKAGGIAVASYGLPNRYRHPCDDVIKDHDDSDWRVARTADHPNEPRESRWL